ncbi:MAG TPA: DMT family transporter [Desulfovibrio sp.]|uniref:DMT family transporter n=1 Tax=Desulfovibrio TaxID=872 RepID=UPI00040F14E5|nr:MULTISPECIES: DMT family transporter [Desulfovibrio]MDY0305084.1 DMT family transporter [Desulfovibrionaceae bacterium]HMM37817.1 DMT family transporter [Desulfovibrio sp.]
MTRSRGDLLALLALVSASTLWASSFVALKVAFRHYDPMLVIFGRMAVASLCFALAWKGLRAGISYRRGDWKPLLFMAVCEPCFYFIFEAMALKHTDASQAGMITAMLPLLVAVAARFVLKEHISRRTLAGFGVAIAGAILLSAGGQATLSSPNPALGNFMEFLAMVCATGYMITLKSLSARYSPWVLTSLQAFVGALFYLPLALGPWAPPIGEFEPLGLAAILYLGMFVTIGGYGFYNYGMSKVPANQASAFINLIPVITLFLGWAMLDEQLSPAQYAASGLVLAGVFLSQDRRKA